MLEEGIGTLNGSISQSWTIGDKIAIEFGHLLGFFWKPVIFGRNSQDSFFGITEISHES
jgi:hypothetical protein